MTYIKSPDHLPHRPELSIKHKFILILGFVTLALGAACGPKTTQTAKGRETGLAGLTPGSWCDPEPGNNGGARIGWRTDKSWFVSIPRGGDSGSAVNAGAECFNPKLPLEDRIRLARELEALYPDRFSKVASNSGNLYVDPRIPLTQLPLPPELLIEFLTD